jgi:hypothetical protein
MENFVEIKNDILERAKASGACVDEYERAYVADTMDVLCAVIRDNFHWCAKNNVLSSEIILKHENLFAEHKIYCNRDASEGHVILSNNTTAKVSGNARAEVSGNATAKVYDNARAWVYNNATAEVYGNATAYLYDNATAEVYDNATAEVYDNATACLYGNATAEVYNN